MHRTIIDTIYKEHTELVSILNEHKEISIKSTTDNKFSKTLILSSASYFEAKIIETIEDFVSKTTQGNESLKQFIRKQALDRKFHTLFDWNSNNINKFFNFFGDESKEKHRKNLKENGELESQISDFLYICKTRNTLVHTNFANQTIDATPEEIFEKYKNALNIIEYIESHLEELGKDND